MPECVPASVSLNVSNSFRSNLRGFARAYARTVVNRAISANSAARTASECQALAAGTNFMAGDLLHPRAVLIVDDNPPLRKAICDLFAHAADFAICGEAENGEDAIEKARLLQPALIVTDLSMPRMNGLDATRVLRKLMPDVRIILYSIHVDAAVAREAEAAGASAVVRKGDSPTHILQIARDLFESMAA
jgi:CheY-like chemotaxis protein